MLPPPPPNPELDGEPKALPPPLPPNSDVAAGLLPKGDGEPNGDPNGDALVLVPGPPKSDVDGAEPKTDEEGVVVEGANTEEGLRSVDADADVDVDVEVGRVNGFKGGFTGGASVAPLVFGVGVDGAAGLPNPPNPVNAAGGAGSLSGAAAARAEKGCGVEEGAPKGDGDGAEERAGGSDLARSSYSFCMSTRRLL
jgi:hypothetical protein